MPGFFTLGKITVAFTCTSFPLNLNTSVFGCGCGFGFEQKFWRINGFGEKKAWITGFAYPYSPPSIGEEANALLAKHGLNFFRTNYKTIEGLRAKRAYIKFWPIFIFCRIELIFGRLTCFDMKSIVL